MKILHAADLHLSRSEKEYSFRVLGEILVLAAQEGCGSLLFAGDVFDSYADAKALRTDFRSALDSLPPGCQVFYLPGNHELLGAGNDDAMGRLDFGRARVLDAVPFSLIELSAEVELLAVPYAPGIPDYRDWDVPEKKKPVRVLLAHGTVPGLTYTGPDQEEGRGCVLDPDLFSVLNIDYAALGHIHTPAVQKIGRTEVVYPGSARVWREGESGPRGIVLFQGRLPIAPQRRVLEEAGEFRDIRLLVDLTGDISEIPEGVSAAGSRDFLRLELSGLVEEEKSVLVQAEALKTRLEKKVRRVSIDTKGLDVLSGISTHPLAAEFLNKWKERYSSAEDEEEKALLRLTRLRGLSALKELLESRK